MAALSSQDFYIPIISYLTKGDNMKKSKMCNIDGCSGGCSYILGFLGAAVYYISTSTGFWNGVLGFCKAVVWPAFLVFEVLKFVGA